MLTKEEIQAFVILYANHLGEVKDGKAEGWDDFVAACSDAFGWSNKTVEVEKVRKRGKNAVEKYISKTNEARANASKIENELRKAGVELPLYIKSRGRKRKAEEPAHDFKFLNKLLFNETNKKGYAKKEREEMALQIEAARNRTRKAKGSAPVQMDIERD